ncbi:DUF4347 domain-containing protein [Sorangium sp. So ce1014]|uniref:DUF4347 domain-containing protein n=1 Tax=Sorangium sp. So ce1014 TaxID=3133326 RepID=UPI003F637383
MQQPVPVRVFVYDKTNTKRKDEEADPSYDCRYLVSSGANDHIFGVADLGEMDVRLRTITQPIEYLTICGHGAKGILGVGSGSAYDYSPGKDICVDALGDIQALLTTLAAQLAPNAYIFLVGCHVGGGKSGERLLCQLSQQLPGRKILASSLYLKPEAYKHKKDGSFTVYTAGGMNLKKGKEVTSNDLTCGVNGEIDLDALPSEEELGFLMRWKANQKAKQH